MTFPRNSLRAFLSHAKSSLKVAIEKKDKVTLVIGNESADLDSICSSILYAYLRSITPPSTLHIPLLNIPRADIPLRPELLALLPRANIDPSHLITLDDLPASSQLKTSLPPQSTSWILVDHNALTGPLSLYNSRLEGCIDHHTDEHTVPASASPRVISTAGSCTSLITNFFAPAWSALSSQSAGAALAQSDTNATTDDAALTSLWDAQVSLLALGAIIIDTRDLRDASKTTEHDKQAVDFLTAKVNLCGKTATTFSRESLFEEIDAAKRDLEGMDVQGVLRKDYKFWEAGGVGLGVASVVKPLLWLGGKAVKENGGEGEGEGWQELVAASTAFAEERELDVFAVMTAFAAETGEFARELLVLAFNGKGVATVEAFAKTAGEKLKLEEIQTGSEQAQTDEEKRIWIWRQGDVTSSRKQVAPLLREAAEVAGGRA